MKKAKKYTDQSYSACVRWVFPIDFTKQVDSKIALKKNIDDVVKKKKVSNFLQMEHFIIV